MKLPSFLCPKSNNYYKRSYDLLHHLERQVGVAGIETLRENADIAMVVDALRELRIYADKDQTGCKPPPESVLAIIDPIVLHGTPGVKLKEVLSIAGEDEHPVLKICVDRNKIYALDYRIKQSKTAIGAYYQRWYWRIVYGY